MLLELETGGLLSSSSTTDHRSLVKRPMVLYVGAADAAKTPIRNGKSGGLV